MKTDPKEWMNRKPYSLELTSLSEVKEPKDYTEYWTITPKKAQEILATSENNRRVKTYRVDQYCRDMLSGRWFPEGSEISISPSGRLLDGQHRLMAIIKADIPINTRVHLNVPENTPFDIGVGRTTGDALKMQGEIPVELANTYIIAMVNTALRNIYGKTAYKAMTNNDRADFINDFGAELEQARLISFRSNSESLCKRAGTQAGIFVALHCGVDPEELESFAEAVNSGVGIDKAHSSANVLRTCLFREKFGHGGANAIDLLMSSTEQAIFDYVRERPRTKQYTTEMHPYAMQMKEELSA